LSVERPIVFRLPPCSLTLAGEQHPARNAECWRREGRFQGDWEGKLQKTRRFSARSYLLGLIAAAVIPVWGFAAYLLISFAIEEQQDYREQAVQLAEQSRLVVDDALGDMLVRLEALSRSEAMEHGDLARLHADARRLVQDTGQIVVLREFGPAQLLNSAVEYGASLPPAFPLSEDDMAELRGGRTRVSNVYRGTVTNEPHIAVAKAVRLGQTEAVLAIAIPTQSIANILVPVIPSGWIVGVGDRTGVYVTRSQRHEEVSGHPGVPEYLAKVVGHAGTFTASNQFGDTLLAGYTHSSLSGWLFAANVPLAIASAPLWSSLYWILALGATALALSLLLAYVVGKNLTKETVQLAARAMDLGSGKAASPLNTRLTEFAVVDEAFATADMTIKTRTSELEAVLDTVPVGVWFTYDPAGRQVVRNRSAAELMAIPIEGRGRFGDPAAVVETIAFKDGKSIGREDRPLTKAMRGELTDHQEYSYRVADGSERHLLTSARPIFDEDGAIVGAVQVSLDISERKRDEEQRRLLATELAHRVKNNLAIVQSLAQQTLRSSASLPEAAKALSARLVALGQAHDILNRRDFSAADLHEVVEKSVLEQAPRHRVDVSGPHVFLPPNLVMALTLSLHELMTNAIKYGALASGKGRISIDWQVADGVVTLLWQEQGGQLPATEASAGFGMRLLERLAKSERGQATIVFEASGLRCTLAYPLHGAAQPESSAAAIGDAGQGVRLYPPGGRHEG
jgi:two-component sensor histidine kinase/PAS domain-containing protein